MRGIVRFSSLLFVLSLFACASPQKIDRVLVEKSKNKMYLLSHDKVIREYDIFLGKNPIGHKQREGDMRTPEGEYLLIHKNNNSKFYRSITVSYPDEEDIKDAMARSMNPGGDIVIHGFPNELGNVTGPVQPLNWTEGCIAVRNHEMDELFDLIELNTPIEIRP